MEKRPVEGEDYDGESRKLIVFFPDVEKLNNKSLEEIALKMIEINCLESIIVIKGTTLISKKVIIDILSCLGTGVVGTL